MIKPRALARGSKGDKLIHLSPRSGRHKEYPWAIRFPIISTISSSAPKIARGLLEDRFREETHRYICGVARSQECTIFVINSVIDHVHLLAKIKPSITVSDFVGKLKANSSRWIKERFDLAYSFQWQNGFSSFTVSESSVDSVMQYIENQQEHHKKTTFAEELKLFLNRHGIEYDPEHYLD